jgi:hypothetical protein
MTKISIDTLGGLRLELYAEATANGGITLGNAFTKLPERKRVPHLSFMPGGEKLDIHFTAGNGSNAFRRKIAHLANDKLVATFERFGAKVLDVYLPSLTPVSLIELEREGWVACGPIWPAVQRWTKYVFRTCGGFRLDADTVKPFVLHLVRHQVPPSSLATQPSVPRRLFALRRNGESWDLLPLVFFPDGCGAPGPDGQPVLVHPPGWYTHPFVLPMDGVVHEHFDSDRIRKTGANVKKWFEQFPVRGRGEQDRSGDDVPPLISAMVGYFSSELLEVAIRAAVEVDADRAPHTKAG